MKRMGSVVCLSLVLILFGAGCGTVRPTRIVSLKRLDPALAGPITVSTDLNRQLRMGSAALISPVETMKSHSALFAYIARAVGRTPEVFQRHTYAETNDLVRTGGVDLALVCSYAYVVGQRDFGMEAIATPVVRGSPEYYSYIIVRADSGITIFEQLRGRVFAFTDPISTSGRLYAEGLLMDRHTTPEEFFGQTTFTFSHDNSIHAVDAGLVDGAAVDSLVYELKIRHDPALGQRLKVIDKSNPFGAPPLVVHPKLDKDFKLRLQQTLLAMHTTEEGRRILGELDIERFVKPDDRWYDSVRRLEEKVRGK